MEAVVGEVRAAPVDAVVVGGDVAWGPFPRETVDVLRGLGEAFFVRGNSDREVAARAGEDEGLDRVTAEITAWTADRLSDDDREWLEALPRAVELEVDGLGEVLFCHGSPRSDEEVITPLSPPERLEAALSSVAHRTVVCGHTHMQFRRRVGDGEVVNAGSVGLPYEGRHGAYWALLGPDIDLRRTDYDVEAAARAMAATTCPHVKEAFIDTLLHPPSPHEAARQFERIEATRRY